MKSIYFRSIISAVLVSILASACSSTNPILIDPKSPIVGQLRFVTGIVMRLDSSSGFVWVAGGPDSTVAGSIVNITPDGAESDEVRALSDGSFLYKFHGNENSSANIDWIDQSGNSKQTDFHVSDPLDYFEPLLNPAGLYPNRIRVRDGKVWSVNSGDDSVQSYDLDTLAPAEINVSLPQFSNPWDVDFISGSAGIVTTLFNGVYLFDSSTGTTRSVDVGNFRDFASPNGLAFLNDEAWIANPNPISYFPTVMGDGWVSRVQTGDNPEVNGEISTQWLNPQNVITDGKYVYVSCSGTIDFLPPDYIATALDEGGIHVIDPDTGSIIASYPLGLAGAGPMAITPDGRFLYAASSIAGWIFRIDLKNGKILNDTDNPIVVNDTPGTFISDLEMTDDGLLICSSFNTDSVHFVDGWTGEVSPFPYFDGVYLHPDEPVFWGIQDMVITERNGREGLLIMTTVVSSFHWLPL